jgi:hypothetical protein
LLGVLPNLLIKNSIIPSVNVLKPRDKHAKTPTNSPARGAYTVSTKKVNMTLTIDHKNPITKLGIGENLIINILSVKPD